MRHFESTSATPVRPVDLRALADHLPDVVYRFRLKPTIGLDYVSGATTRLTGYAPEDLYADPRIVFEIVHPDDRQLVEELLSLGPRPQPLLLRWIRKDGTTVWAEHRDAAAYDEAGELVAIEGVARTVPDPTRKPGESVRLVGGLRIDLADQLVSVDGKPVRLTPSEFKLLARLSATPGETVSRQELMHHLWRSAHTGSGHACETYVSNLRRKIERDARFPERIVTARGRGYRLLAV